VFAVGALGVGDIVDGASVVARAEVPYDEPYT
jgi:hypothetical protein